MRTRNMIIVSLLLPLGACAAPEHLRPDFGYSYQVDTTVQQVDPDAANRPHQVAFSDGEKIEQALKDYRKGKPEATRDHLLINTVK